ncbi:hypothetical protein H4R18_001205 [Coemansia javaensis]|uniref:F-box domain-containing protein n=1 Tax=Coemansia javaensis TaxID=2761396 RepID=A0A9W8LLY8_9FUNG|nr:hypothetical protein H4R18_001205 [Coemansia javaensis]
MLASLPLLAVCQRWRCLALPAVYSTVFIKYYAEFNSDGSESSPEAFSVVTNLDLAISAGCLGVVRKVEIDVRCSANPFPGLGVAIQMLRAAAEEWRGPVSLGISLYPEFLAFGRTGHAIAPYGDDIKQASAVLAAMLPRVRHMSFGGVRMDSIARELFGRLASLYADRLCAIDSQHPITVPRDCVFTQLRSVCVARDSRVGYQLPRMDPAMLVKLELPGWPPEHSWAPFSMDGDSALINFPNLKLLDFQCYDIFAAEEPMERCQDGRAWKLCFPKLQELRIDSVWNSCPLLEHAVLPAHMDAISIETPPALLQYVSGLSLPATRSLTIGINEGGEDGAAALATANRILNGARGSEERILNICDHALSVLPEAITCTLITQLTIAPAISVDTVLNLVQRLPSLTSLEVYTCLTDGAQADLSVPEPGSGYMVDPFETKMKKMYISGHEQNALVALAKYLLLRIPTLQTFGSLDIPERLIVAFVGAYLEQYPRLADIRLELGSSD